MNITKKQWMIIGIVIAVIAVWYFFLRKKPVESNYRMTGFNRKLPAGTYTGADMMTASAGSTPRPKKCNCYDKDGKWTGANENCCNTAPTA